MIGRISKVRKRDGRLVDFDETKIADAIYKAACATGGEDRFLAEELSGVVNLFLEKRFAGSVPQIEEIQDMVEKVLIETGHARTAKAYILYRDRRARAREHVTVRVEGLGGDVGGPLVGNPVKALVSPWAKHRIAAALVREADLDEKVAAEAAGRVETKVFQSGLKRITTLQIRSLVESELFLMGYSESVARQALVGVPRFDVDELLRGAKRQAWRPSGPRDLKRTVADAVLSQYALAEVYSAEVVDAHLDARLHLLDVGSPFEWVAVAARVGRTAGADSWLESLALKAERLSSVATREVCLTGFGSPSGNGAEIETARRILGHPTLASLDTRGGRFRLALDLPLVDADEEAATLAGALVREHWARFREGVVRGLPELSLRLPAGAAEDESHRAALLPALAASAETGRTRFVFERDGPPALVTPWYRIAGAEAAEEWSAAGESAIGVNGATALNVLHLAAALAEPEEGALLEAVEGALVVAVKALRQKRSFMAALGSDPATPLYRVSGGARPLVAGSRGFDLVHLVGVRAAARLLIADPEEASRLAGRLRSYAAIRAAEEGRRVRLRVVTAPDRDGEAGRRFLAAERRRDDRVAHAFPEEGGALDEAETWPLPDGPELPAAESTWDPASGTLRLRFPRDQAPGPEALYDALRQWAREPRVHCLHLSPWPDRLVRTVDPARPI